MKLLWWLQRDAQVLEEIRLHRERQKLERREQRREKRDYVAIVIAVLAAIFTGWQAWEAHETRKDMQQQFGQAQRQAGMDAEQARKDSQTALESQTKMADHSAKQAARSAAAAETANSLAVTAMRQAQRPWIGPDIKAPVVTGPITIDGRGFISTTYQMTAINYGNFGANNINFWAQLYITQDLATIWKRGKYACSAASGDSGQGRIMFPGQERIMTNPWPAFAMDIIPNKKAVSPQKEYQAYLLTCIGYRDQFQTPHHTETIFRSVKPDTGETLMFELTPNQTIPVQWREWHSSLD
jgi:hypothetical protein